jgi:hypothetical protein
MDCERTLWTQVVLQARDDLADADRLSFNFNQAYAFFTGRHDWRRSREDIAECIGLHVDDLERLGRQTLAARTDQAVEQKVEPVKLKSDPVPAIVHRPEPSLSVVPAKRGRPRNAVRDRNWWIQDFLRREAA